MTTYKIVKTSNDDSDYYDEKFVENLPVLTSKQSANCIAWEINKAVEPTGPDYYKVVEKGYALTTSDPN